MREPVEQERDEVRPADGSTGADPLVGRALAGKYSIEGVLGSGAMGTVYEARHLAMKRTVALKAMRPELMKHERLVRRFQREAQAASRIVSPHVVTLYDFGHDESGVDYLAMERLEGESLGARLRRSGALGPLEAVEVGIGIAEALRAAHEARVVHRDLKPDNVFITDDGVVKVLDFGIAKIFEEGGPLDDMSTFTGIGAVAGTPLYMSPEAARRRPVGPPADVYALGILLYQMISGSPPFEHEAPIMVMGMHIRSRPQRLTARCPDLSLPDSLDGLVRDMLAKKPEKRPDAGECLERLRACKAQLEQIETGETSVMSRHELPLEQQPQPPTDAGPGPENVQDTVPTDQPLMYEDVVAEAERRKEAAHAAAQEEAYGLASDTVPLPTEVQEHGDEPPPRREREMPTQRIVETTSRSATRSRGAVVAAGATLAGVVVVVLALVYTGQSADHDLDRTNPVGASSTGAAPQPAALERDREPERAAPETTTSGTTPTDDTPATATPAEDAPATATPAEDAPADEPASEGSGAEVDRATLRVTSRPSAEIFLDGAPTGHRTPSTIFRVRTGHRRVRLMTDDGRQVEIPVELVGGETHRLHHDF